MSPFEEGINHPRGDLAGTGTESESKQECATRCLRDNECKAMTFVHHPDGVGGICWLKGTINSATPHPDMVSAVKMYP